MSEISRLQDDVKMLRRDLFRSQLCLELLEKRHDRLVLVTFALFCACLVLSGLALAV